MESENITLEITYTVKDVRPFLIRANRRTLALTVIYVFAALFIAYVAAAHVVTNDISESFRLGAVAYLIAAPLLTVVINVSAYHRAAGKSAAGRSPLTLEITETGITARGKNRTAITKWGGYKNAIEYKDKFVINTDLGHGLLIPKRCFSSDERIRSFKDLLERSLSGKVENKVKPD